MKLTLPATLGVASILVSLLPSLARGPSGQDREQQLARAEAFLAEGSYELARRAFAELAASELSPEQARWVEFRLADSSWRSLAASEQHDPSAVEAARLKLEEIAARATRPEERDRTWAEVQESLGDFWWQSNWYRDFGGGLSRYRAAMEWWASARDVEMARERWLAMLWRLARPRWAWEGWTPWSYGNALPLDLLEDALEVAQETADRAQVEYLYATALSQQVSGPNGSLSVERHFEAALSAGRESTAHDDALFAYAQWLESSGRWVRRADGSLATETDAAGALALYQRLVKDYREGESPWWHQARERAQAIVAPELQLWVESWFVPGSEIAYQVGWRNVGEIEFELWSADLVERVRFSDPGLDAGRWLESLDRTGREPSRRWKHATGDRGDHQPGQATLALDEKLPAGAWLLVARAKGLERRELLLVTDAALVVKAVGNKVLAWTTGAQDGKPLGGADVSVWARMHDDRGGVRWARHTASTGVDGVALVELPAEQRYYELFVAARSGSHQAFSTLSTSDEDPATGWRIYACTDRPAYRPGQGVRWKAIVRRFQGLAYRTPADQTIAWSVTGPRGDEIAHGDLQLNRFGGAWGMLETDAKMALGSYQIHFGYPTKGDLLGTAELFRLEEYKLPDFEVRVSTPDDPERPGQPQRHVLGDLIEAEIEASLYAGGGVAGATVEVVVTQRPWWRNWRPLREDDWFARALRPDWGGDGRWNWGGEEVLRKTLTTDETGRARVRFASPEGGQQDLEYHIEARVTDASRRMVAGSGRVRVTQRSYFVGVSSPHRFYAPGKPVELHFEARDANETPVVALGVGHLLRARWIEEWVGPAGEVVAGSELVLRKQAGHFPPGGWWCRRAEYAYEEVARSALATDEKGKAVWTPTPAAEGAYVARWVSQDPRGGEIVAESWVYVCSRSTRDLDRQSGRLEILVDQESVAEGARTAVMLASDASGRHVLFTVEGAGLIEWRVVHMSGRVELLDLEVSESWVPNAFLTGTLVADGSVERAGVELTVPPTRRFLDVEVTSDAPEHKPGEAGVIDVVVRDHEGKPVQAELALSLYDESLTAIQAERAGDVRTFFYGHPRGPGVTSASSLDARRLRKLERDAEGRVVEQSVDKEGLAQLRQMGYADDRDGGEGDFALGAVAKSRAREEMDVSLAANSPARPDFAAAEAPGAGSAGGEPATVVVRSDFRETALWAPDLVTDAEGHARAELVYPDSTTRWRAIVRAADEGSRVGWVQESPVRTSLPLVARLAAPRFFVVGDEVVVSAVFDNHTDAPLTVTPRLSVEGLELVGATEGEHEAGGAEIPVAPHGQGRADWRVHARSAGSARLVVTGMAGEYVDAMEKTLPVREHGIDVLISDSGRLDGEELVHVFELPEARRAGSTRMHVSVAPSLAVTMLDALPYLVDYPYGCTEQTLSRFVPTIVAARTLAELGLSRESVLERVFGGIEAEHAARTHPKGKEAFAALDRIVSESLARLESSQLADGGFGWWPGGDSDAFMTAYALWALVLARDAGEDVSENMLERAASWLDLHLADVESRLDLQAWMLHALAEWWRASARGQSEFGAKAYANLWGRRGELNAYARALLALIAQRGGRADDARVLVRNLENGVVIEDAPGASDIGGGAGSARARTAHWGESGLVWRWSEGGVEATAFALRALLAIDPGHELVPAVVQWLVQNRRGAQWKSTRDTSIVVLALCDYLEQTKEAARDVAYEVLVNGESLARVELAASQGLAAPSAFPVSAPRSGRNEIRLRRLSGSGPLYWSVSASFFSEEEPIPARGGDLFVRRDAYRLVGHPTLFGGEVFERVLLGADGVVASGERVEIVLTVEARQDLEYLVVEDLKAAGLEAVDVQSGGATARELRKDELERRFGADRAARYESRGDQASRPEVGTTGRERYVWRELREAHVAYFFDRLPEGVWELRTMLRAEAPGRFHWLPAKGWAMYVPEIRANGFESALSVRD